jgi:hypothetical protein
MIAEMLRIFVDWAVSYSIANLFTRAYGVVYDFHFLL